MSFDRLNIFNGDAVLLWTWSFENFYFSKGRAKSNEQWHYNNCCRYSINCMVKLTFFSSPPPFSSNRKQRLNIKKNSTPGRSKNEHRFPEWGAGYYDWCPNPFSHAQNIPTCCRMLVVWRAAACAHSHFHAHSLTERCRTQPNNPILSYRIEAEPNRGNKKQKR